MADFTYVADKTVEEEIQFDTLISEAENGFEQRRSRRDNAIRKFKLFYTNRTSSEMTEVAEFFEGKKGSLTSFTWENPNDSTTYTVRFADDSFKFKRVAFNIFSFEVSLLEVLA
jgi:uncharacterized protein (TIGR02217 family)